MKKKELKQLKEKDKKDLEKMVGQKKIDLIKAKADIIAGREKNLKKVKNLKDEIAQVMTLITEKEILEIESRVEKKEEEVKS